MPAIAPEGDWDEGALLCSNNDWKAPTTVPRYDFKRHAAVMVRIASETAWGTIFYPDPEWRIPTPDIRLLRGKTQRLVLTPYYQQTLDSIAYALGREEHDRAVQEACAVGSMWAKSGSMYGADFVHHANVVEAEAETWLRAYVERFVKAAPPEEEAAPKPLTFLDRLAAKYGVRETDDGMRIYATPSSPISQKVYLAAANIGGNRDRDDGMRVFTGAPNAAQRLWLDTEVQRAADLGAMFFVDKSHRECIAYTRPTAAPPPNEDLVRNIAEALHPRCATERYYVSTGITHVVVDIVRADADLVT